MRTDNDSFFGKVCYVLLMGTVGIYAIGFLLVAVAAMGWIFSLIF